MFFTEEKISEIVEKNDIVDVISSYLTLTKKGNNHLGLCPFHSEKSPSFSVSPTKQIFYCFGCTTGGNVIKFIEKIEHCSFIEALQLLAQRAGVDLPIADEKYLDKSKAQKKLYDISKEAARFFHNNLLKSNIAMEYFEMRGLDDSTIKKFGLGYSLTAWDGLFKHLKSMKYTEKEMLDAGLILAKKDGSGYFDRFRNRIMFPIIDVKGNVIAFGGRVLDNSLPKYLNSPDTLIYNKKNNMYALNIAKTIQGIKEIIIVEGYMDVIALHQYGINNVVASLGTAFTEQQAKLLRRYVNNIVIAYDMDNAGQTATIKGMNLLEKHGAVVKILRVPNGKDPDEFIRKEGVESFKKLILNAIPLIDYRIELIKSSVNLDTIQGRVDFAKGIAEVLTELNSSVAIDEYIKKYSKQAQISETAMYAELNNLKDKNKIGNISNNTIINKNISRKVTITAEELMERMLIALLISNKTAAKIIYDKVSVDNFEGEFNKMLVKNIFSSIKEGKTVSGGELLCYIDTDENKNLAMEIFNTNIENISDKSTLTKLLDKFLQNDINMEVQKLTNKMNELYKENKYDEANAIFIEISKLIKNTNKVEVK